MSSQPLTSIFRSTWCLALLGIALILGLPQPGFSENRPSKWKEPVEDHSHIRFIAPPAERLDPHTEYALDAIVAAYILIHGELPTAIDQVKPMLMFNNEFSQFNLDDLIRRHYTLIPEESSLKALALEEALPFLGACTTFHKNAPAPQDPEFRLALQVGLLSNAMMSHGQKHASAPHNLDELAANWGGYNEAAWINPYTGKPMLRVATSVARTTEHAGDYAESTRHDRLRILLYRRDEQGLSQPILIWFGDDGSQQRNFQRPFPPMIVVTENMPDWPLGDHFF